MDAFKVRFLCARGRGTLMADIASPEKRSQNMSAIRSKNTKAVAEEVLTHIGAYKLFWDFTGTAGTFRRSGRRRCPRTRG